VVAREPLLHYSLSRVINAGGAYMFGGGNKIKLSDTVFQKARVAAGILGCSIEEFIERSIEGEAERTMAQTSNKEPTQAEVDEISKQLQGLGYLE